MNQTPAHHRAIASCCVSASICNTTRCRAVSPSVALVFLYSMPALYSSRQHYACVGLVLLPATALTFIISTLLCQHLQHSLSCVRIEQRAPPQLRPTQVDTSRLVHIYVQPLPPSLFGLTPGEAELFFAQHFSAPLGPPVNGTDLSLRNTSQSATGMHRMTTGLMVQNPARSDAHFWEQLLSSPLRVASEARADLTFVPCPVALYTYAIARGALQPVHTYSKLHRTFPRRRQ